MKRVLAALALVVAGVGFAPAPATAAGGYCTDGGANVVVDYGALGGGTLRSCGAPGTAAAVFDSAGVALTYNPRMGPGFVCTVDGKPADRQCSGTDSYWALFIARPGGGWAYTSRGAGSQPVGDGDTIAFAWQSGNGQREPRVAPAAATKSAPTTDPTTGSGPTGGNGSTGPASGNGGSTGTVGGGRDHAGAKTPAGRGPDGAASGRPGGSPSASPSAGHHEQGAKAGSARKGHRPAKASASPSARSGRAADLTRASLTADGGDSGGGLPWWVPAGVVVLLGAGGGAAAWRRTRGAKAP